MKNITSVLAISSALFMVSCNKKAEDINLENKLIQTVKTQSLSIRGSELDPIVRGITLISYPLESDVQKNGALYKYDMGEDLYDLTVNSSLKTFSYGDELEESELEDTLVYKSRVEQRIDEANSFNTVKELVKHVVTVGDLRDRVMNNFMDNQLVYKSLESKFEKANEKVSDTLSFFVITEGDHEGMMLMSPNDDFSVESIDIEDCEGLSEVDEDYLLTDFISEENLESFESAVESCDSVEFNEDDMETVAEDMSEKIYDFDFEEINQEGPFYAAKGYITNLLNDLETFSGQKFLSTGDCKETYLDGGADQSLEISQIVFNEQMNGFDKLLLNLDLLGSGAKVYSVENGLIKNIKFRKTILNQDVVSFDIIGEDVVVKTELGLSNMKNLGVRLIGDANFIYSNGRKTRGVMKLELDITNKEIFPFDIDSL
ncbi:MAG: hypothetical protein BM556_02500 [Bacteriovorax sp. MedPE-SWde]|nr:MAG: hypothetical protein BM556_02500 [Bacteriovorax sp. MedPE-SWde]